MQIFTIISVSSKQGTWNIQNNKIIVPGNNLCATQTKSFSFIAQRQRVGKKQKKKKRSNILKSELNETTTLNND